MAERATSSEAEEILAYRPGQKVEFKHRPGVIDTVIGYDPYMVPPVILANDPQPRYPEELTVVTQPGHAFDWLNSLSRKRSTGRTVTKGQQLVTSRS
jgi:hypothetical protein